MYSSSPEILAEANSREEILTILARDHPCTICTIWVVDEKGNETLAWQDNNPLLMEGAYSTA